MTNKLGTPSSELQTNFGALQINAENFATGVLIIGHLKQISKNYLVLTFECSAICEEK